MWVDRKGVETPLNAPARPYESVALAPDASRIAVGIDDQERDVWTWDLRRQTLTRITADPRNDRDPVWTPDGQRLIFRSRRNGPHNLYSQSADGTGLAERLTTGLATFVPSSISGDGAYLLGNYADSPPWQLFVLPLDNRGAAAPAVRPLVRGNNPVASPNGRYVAYGSNESGQLEIYVRPFPNVSEGPRWTISTAGGTNAEWSKQGRELFFLDGEGRLTGVKVDTSGPAFRAEVPVQVLAASYYRDADTPHVYDVSADGTRFLMIKEEPTARRTAGRIVVVLNALESLMAGTGAR